MSKEMPFMEHLIELRKRVIRSVLGVTVAFFVAYHYSERAFDFLVRPLCKAFGQKECSMVYTGIAEPFLVYLKVGVVGGIFLAAPWLFYQIWGFISPGLKEKE